jgi:hypothetical protein
LKRLRAAAESAERRLIHPAVGGAALTYK